MNVVATSERGMSSAYAGVVIEGRTAPTRGNERRSASPAAEKAGRFATKNSSSLRKMHLRWEKLANFALSVSGAGDGSVRVHVGMILFRLRKVISLVYSIPLTARGPFPIQQACRALCFSLTLWQFIYEIEDKLIQIIGSVCSSFGSHPHVN